MRLIRLWPVLAGMLVGFLWADARAQDPGGSVTLQWTAPGDDSLTGTAARYDLRYSLFPITDLNFVYCWASSGLPKPAVPGTLQRFTVFGLLPGFRYYFALKTADERLNWSKISNVVAFAQQAVGVDINLPLPQFAPPFPNPARASTTFNYALATADRVDVDVFDVSGRLVHNLARSYQPAGPGQLNWNLRDNSGARVEPGVYMVKARLGSLEFSRKLLVVR